ncbi:lipoyl synthase [Thermodesulfobacteriota bacterium]
MNLRQSDSEATTRKKSIRGKITRDDLKKIHNTKKILRKNRINTVCESARCPNLNECFKKLNATFIILGNACTRNCAFCAVESSPPQPVDLNEPKNVARTVSELKLKHVVITSVTRDDLSDKGIDQFINSVKEVKRVSPDTSIELLTPDFKGISDEHLFELVNQDISIFGHNVEMARSLYAGLRGKSDYDLSLSLLKKVKAMRAELDTKTAIMLGLGETFDEVTTLLNEIHDTGCDIIVIGQYLQPTLKHAKVVRYLSDDEFTRLYGLALSIGFKRVYSFAKARSSYTSTIS